MSNKFDNTSIIAIILVLGMAFIEIITMPSLIIFLYILCALWFFFIIYEFIKTKNYTNLLIKIFIVIIFILETKQQLIKVFQN